MYHIGLDYHARTSSIHMLNGEGKRVKSLRINGGSQKVITTLQHLTSRIDQPVTVCYEASTAYGHLFDQLEKFVSHVSVAHPADLRLIFKSKRKNDRVDAQKLAMLSLLDQVPKVHVPTSDVRGWRRLIEFRHRRVAERTRIKNKVRALLRAHGITGPSRSKLWSKAGLKWLAAVQFPEPMDGFMRDMAIDDIRQCNEKIRDVEKHLNRISRQHPGVALLKTIPGVGDRTAEAIMAYIDRPNRFRRNKSIGNYFGLIPCEDSSSTTQRLGHITKEGPATARKLLVEASWQAIRRSPTVRAYFERIAGGKKDRRKVALVATAHYLARVMLAMLKSGEAWRESETINSES